MKGNLSPCCVAAARQKTLQEDASKIMDEKLLFIKLCFLICYKNYIEKSEMTCQTYQGKINLRS